MTQDERIIIVGAGAAGLAAANALKRAGIETLVLEGRDRIGGRIHTLHDPKFQIPLERGAEFIHGQPKPTWEIVQDASLLAYEVSENHWLLKRRKAEPQPDLWERLENVVSGVKKLRNDVSFENYLQRNRNSPDIKRFAAMFVEGFDAAHLDQISAKSLAAEERQIGQDATQFRLIEGYDAAIRFLARKIEPSVRLNTAAVRIQWKRGGVIVTTQTAEQHFARGVIITLPVGLLQANTIEFQPPMGSKHKPLSLLGVGPVVKVILRFRKPFWETRMKGMSFVHAPGETIPTWWNMLPIRTRILTGWAGGPNADRLSHRANSDVVGESIRTLAKIFGLSRRKLSELVETSIVADWQADPWARGAYSYVKVGGEQARKQLAQPIGGTLFFAGEATDTSGEAGTVAGAIASGQRAARQVLRTIHR